MKRIKNFAKRHLPKSISRIIVATRRKHRGIRNAKNFEGNNVYCPCCNKCFSSFQKFMYSDDFHHKYFYTNTVLNVVCPYCESYPRHRIICDYLEKNNKFMKGLKILLFSPANGIQLWFGRNKIKYIYSEYSDITADVNIDIQNIPYSENEFDFISCDHILEHVRNYLAAIKELYRVIKPNGYVEITVPILMDLKTTKEDDNLVSSEERIKAFGQEDHLRIFGMDFIEKLREIGFIVEIYDGDNLDEKIMPLIAPAIYDYNKVFICKK